MQEAVLRLTSAGGERFWRVEDSLVDLGAVRPLAFLGRNSHRYSERWKRVGCLYSLAVLRVLLYATSPALSSRVLHLALRGMSRDRLDVLSEEYFHVFLKPRLKRTGIEALHRRMAEHRDVVLVSQGLEHVVRPLAKHLGVDRFLANRLEFRDGIATGRLLEPIVHSRGGIAKLASRDSSGDATLTEISTAVGVDTSLLRRAVLPAEPPPQVRRQPIVLFDESKRIDAISVRESLAGKNILLIGVTGFIGKVWFAKTLEELPEIGHIYLLVRRQRAVPAQRRVEKMIEESPVFEPLFRKHGDNLARFVGKRVTVLEGDAEQPDLGLPADSLEPLLHTLDVIVNSGGLTDFNPDLRNALAANVDSIVHMLDLVRRTDHAALLHLSTCYVVGQRDGRIAETLQPNYVPIDNATFDADRERQALSERIERAKEWPPNPELLRELHLALEDDAADPGATLPPHGDHGRLGWLRRVLTETGVQRARELGWPNSYVFTKSLGESLIAKHGAGLPIAVVRPSIVETSLHEPFVGWNEGINTSAPLSYLLGTTFRQLPANERKCLDIIPVDLVCRGMTLVAAALVERCHQPLYQMATSVSNPCNMKRSIELTSLAHRKHYRQQKGHRYWWKMRMDAIPVSKARYERLSAPRYKAVISRMRRFLSPMPFRIKALARAERAVSRVAKLVEIYEPFILENEHVFEAENMEILSRALPATERATFAYEASSFGWRDYWIDVHIPAMRKWCYPLIEGRALPSRRRAAMRLPQRQRALRGIDQEAIGT